MKSTKILILESLTAGHPSHHCISIIIVLISSVEMLRSFVATCCCSSVPSEDVPDSICAFWWLCCHLPSSALRG